MILITFYSNDGTDRTETQTATKGDEVTLNANTWTRNGYWFMGWYSQADNPFGYMERPDEQTFTAGQSNMNLYAAWRPFDLPFNSITDFKNFLDNLPANTADTPYSFKVNIGDLGGAYDTTGSLAYVLRQKLTAVNFSLYVNLDLSGSTFNSIPQSGFWGCGLTSVTIPASVTSIGEQAFLANDLTSATILATTPPTGNLWANDGDFPIYVPAGSVDAYKAATGWSSYGNRIQAIQ